LHAPRELETFLDKGLGFAKIFVLLNKQRLSRVAEGTGPTTPQQPGASAKVLTPAQWG